MIKEFKATGLRAYVEKMDFETLEYVYFAASETAPDAAFSFLNVHLI